MPPCETNSPVPGLSTDEILVVIESVVCLLAPSFAFGYYTVEDMMQEGRAFSWEALPRFNPTAGNPSPERDNTADRLYNFLRKHVRNRFLNLVRDKYERSDKHVKDDPRWQSLNESKRILASSLPSLVDQQETAYEEPQEDYAECLQLIEAHLPQEMMNDYKRMLHGAFVPSGRRMRVKETMLEILASGGLEL